MFQNKADFFYFLSIDKNMRNSFAAFLDKELSEETEVLHTAAIDALVKPQDCAVALQQKGKVDYITLLLYRVKQLNNC